KVIKRFSTDYPKKMAEFPTIIYRTSSKAQEVDAFKNESQTFWAIYFEVFCDNSTTEVVNELTDRMTGLGFKRTNAQDQNLGVAKHSLLTFQAVVDNDLKQVYLK
ncbi:hypothetical protein V6O07_16750, partial [Arthrospira platensis SPKY2]